MVINVVDSIDGTFAMPRHFFGKELLVFVEVCCRFVVFCWPSICNH